ncbi:hypothetical protein LshimejAT787_0604080 [Lyophyllum shimeji]|uniref:Uncharacterized protein n=1 Tax=Lyophyllum shimeji TaxID=47721 RepID=A0A9P3PP76_LYOSH|nr:hypothetical protein LshimejAT787_0604080 [Lyophyllum shimeji]
MLIRSLLEHSVAPCDRSCTSLKCIAALIPNFLRKIGGSEPQDLQDFYDVLESSAGDARSDDTAKLEEEIANWPNIRTPAPVPILNANLRANCGLQYDVTGRLLRPTEFDWETLQVLEKVRDCDPAYNSASSPFLRTLYAFEKDDPKEVFKGLLMSGLLVRTFKYVLTSPSSSKVIHQESIDLAKIAVILKADSTNKKARRRDASRGIINQANHLLELRNGKAGLSGLQPRSTGLASLVVVVPLPASGRLSTTVLNNTAGFAITKTSYHTRSPPSFGGHIITQKCLHSRHTH